MYLQALEAEKPSGIHVFAVLLHAHLAGRGIRLRHFRKGAEMKLLAYDDDFDFNFQEFQYLREEQTILPVCTFRLFLFNGSKEPIEI